MNRFRIAAVVLFTFLSLTSCDRYLPGLLEPAASATPTEMPPPSPTPVPLAAQVNGEPISLASFEREVERYEAAQLASGIDLATLGAYRDQVLSAMIELKLLAQGALTQGLSVEPAEIDQRYAGLVAEFTDESAFNAWLEGQDFTEDELRASLTEQVLGARMVASIVGNVPQVVEQVHARHILVASQAEAEEIRGMLASGSDFATLANQVSLDISTRPAGGDLGWFPQGYLWLPQVEQAAFSLQPGEISDVVESELGYHIVETLERGDHRTDADVQRWLREQAVQDWLAQQRSASEIELYITP
jgi:parvulin-like peptidyl-prolyl isomerase